MPFIVRWNNRFTVVDGSLYNVPSQNLLLRDSVWIDRRRHHSVSLLLLPLYLVSVFFYLAICRASFSLWNSPLSFSAAFYWWWWWRRHPTLNNSLPNWMTPIFSMYWCYRLALPLMHSFFSAILVPDLLYHRPLSMYYIFRCGSWTETSLPFTNTTNK